MGINYSIDAERRIVRLTYVGVVDVGELMASMRAIFRSLDYRPGFGFLVDRRMAEVPPLGPVRRMVAFTTLYRAALTGSSWALVVARQAAAGTGRLEQMGATGATIDQQVFTEMEEAEAWLRLTAAEK